MLTRRGMVLGAAALGACAPRAMVDQRFAAIEQRVGGRLGVAAWNTAIDVWIVHRAHERLCSTEPLDINDGFSFFSMGEEGEDED